MSGKRTTPSASRTPRGVIAASPPATSAEPLPVILAELEALSTTEILFRTHSLRVTGRRHKTQLVAHLLMLVERKAHIDAGYKHPEKYFADVFGMPVGTAYRYGTAVRVARRFPQVLDMLESGAMNLRGLELLEGRLTAENFDAVMAEVTYKPEEEIRLSLARRFPPADGEPAAREVKRRKTNNYTQLSDAAKAMMTGLSAPAREALQRAVDLAWIRDDETKFDDFVRKLCEEYSANAEAQLQADYDKHLATQRKNGKKNKPGYVSPPAKRLALAKCGLRCTYCSAAGKRCDSKTDLEIDHIKSKARGGIDDLANLTVLCGPHNRRKAELELGEGVVREKIRVKKELARAQKARAPSERPVSETERRKKVSA
jgi:5-methylcytosine-specific restriction endonuclease McrA